MTEDTGRIAAIQKLTEEMGTLKQSQERALALVKQEHAGDLANLKQEMLQVIKKTDESTRRKILNDERRAEKRKHSEMELETALYVQRKKSDVELAKETVVQDKTATTKIEREIELYKLTHGIVPDINEGVTMREVADKHGLLVNLGTYTDSVLGQASKLVQKEPYLLVPLDATTTELYGNNRGMQVNQYNAKYEPNMVNAIKSCIENHHLKHNTPTQAATSNRLINSFFKP